MDNSTRLALLKSISFGEQIAEDEREKLKDYFISTESWERVYNDMVDVIYGTKGSGKSAIYSVLEISSSRLQYERGVLLIPAENPRGNTVFRNLNNNPPTSELEFINLWKLYLLVICTNTLIKEKVKNKKISSVHKVLADSGLGDSSANLRQFLHSCFEYVKHCLLVLKLI